MMPRPSTMWDTLSWGGETQALIYTRNTRKRIGINALAFAPTGATPEILSQEGMNYPPSSARSPRSLPNTGAVSVTCSPSTRARGHHEPRRGAGPQKKNGGR